jgi:two-component system response regulator FixJ
MTNQRRIALIDDDPALRDSLGLLFETSGYAVGVYVSVDAFIEAAPSCEPICIVLDHTLPGRNGVDSLEEINRAAPTASIVVLTGYASVPLAVLAIRAGVFEFLEKPVDPALLLDVVARAALEAETKETEVAAEAEIRRRLASLTEREREVLGLMIEGATNKVVANKLGISPRTLEIHRARVMEKLGCRGPVELYRRYGNAI